MLGRMCRIAFLVLIVLGLPSQGSAAKVETPEAPHAAAEAHGGENAGAPREHGLMEFDATSAVWTLVIFGVLLVVLYLTAWKNVLAGLKAREQRIRNDIAEAESTRAKAEAT